MTTFMGFIRMQKSNPQKLKYLRPNKGNMAKIALRCSSCRYKFSRSVAPNLCPFCGKATIAEDTSSSAEDLLREVDEMERGMSGRR
jgi:predicted RNA-binding Zn-ribbon protein involved in translation (DUF1610 family)